MVERRTGLNVQQDREYLTAETESYRKLVANGFTPQGCTKDFKQVVVYKIIKEHERDGKDVYYFKNWQKAAEMLCK